MPKLTTADAQDRHSYWLAWGVIFAGLRYLASATKLVSDGTSERALDGAEVVFAVLTVVCIVPGLAFKWFRLPAAERQAYFSTDSFVGSMLLKAQRVSWLCALLTLILLEGVSRRLEPLPLEFSLQVPLAVLFGSLGIAFLVLSRGAAAEG